MAGDQATRKEGVLIPFRKVVLLGLGQEHPSLIGVQVAPAHRPVLQGEIKRSVLVAGQLHARARIALVANGPDAQSIGGRRQVGNVVVALLVGQDAHRHLVLRILGNHERSHERAPSGPFTVPVMVPANVSEAKDFDAV